MNDAVIWISLLNDAAVSLFGGILAASFCGALDTARKWGIFLLGMAIILIPQGMLYHLEDAWFRMQIYPLAMHLPLLLLLYILTRKWLWPAVSVLSAYLFCEMRRWLALLAEAMLPGEKMTRQLVELALTLPLLLLLLRFVAPAFRQLMEHPVRIQCQFGLIPALYYGFDYLTRIYTDLLFSGSPVVVEFMPTVCCVAYLAFLLHNSAAERRRNILQQIQDNLNLQVSQASREISALRESQNMAARHRHDLRHHLQYLLSCVENGETGRAKNYILRICEELEAQQVRRYCENEAVNLILSAFAKRAEETGVKMDIQGALPRRLPVSDNDLCIIFSNALENALHACLPLAAAGTPCTIGIQFRLREADSRLLLQVDNPCPGEVRFERGLPVSSRPGHGIGVQSIRATVERYGGGCTFLKKGGQFILRLFL